MSEPQTGGADGETITEGAVKGGNGNYFFDLDEEEVVDAGGAYSTAAGGLVEGERHQAGLMTMEAGTGAAPHTHPNEQFIFVLEGEVRLRIADEEAMVTPGGLAYIPADTIHSAEVVSEEDVRFFTTKDLRHGIVGELVEE